MEDWCDASSRRVAKSELLNGQTKKWLYLYDGWDIIGLMNEAGQLRESYARGVGLAGDIGTLVAVRHHPGSSVSPGTYYTHCNHRGDIVLTRSGTTTVGSYVYSAFGTLKSQIGTDVSRFKFSSKERDAATGFSYYGYRFYAPKWQRWVSTDPLANEGSMINTRIEPRLELVTLDEIEAIIEAANDPLATFLRINLNLYGALDNNPVSNIDPFGLKPSAAEYAFCVAVCVLTGDLTYGGAVILAADHTAKHGKGADRRMAKKQVKRIAKKLGLRAATRFLPFVGYALIAVDTARCGFECMDECKVRRAK